MQKPTLRADKKKRSNVSITFHPDIDDITFSIMDLKIWKKEKIEKVTKQDVEKNLRNMYYTFGHNIYVSIEDYDTEELRKKAFAKAEQLYPEFK